MFTLFISGLEEIQIDGDSPQCPACGCVWIHIPNFENSLTYDGDDDDVDDDNDNDKVDEIDKSSDRVKMICSSSSSEQIDNRQTDSSNQQTKIHQFDDQYHHCQLYRRRYNQHFQQQQHEPQEQQPQLRKQQSDETSCCSLQNQPISLNPDTNLTSNMTIVDGTLLSDPPFSEYNSCVSAFSLEIANALVSNEWTIRQYALQQATHLTIRQVLLARQCHLHSEHSNLVCSVNHHNSVCDTPTNCQMYTGPDCVRLMFKLVQHLLDDPVDAIFTDALRAFRELLGYLVCYNKETQFVGGSSNLWSLRSPETLLHSIHHQDEEVRTIVNNTKKLDLLISQTNPKILENNSTKLIRKTDETNVLQAKSQSSLSAPAANFRDRSNLALATLIELAKGQSGALALGREVQSAPQCLPVSGIQHMVRFVLSSAKFHATHLIGRLTIVDKLIRMHQARMQEFMPQQQQQQSASNQVLLSRDTMNNNTTTSDISSSIDKISVQGDTPSPISSPSADQSLARRHLCSTIVFARRHLLPIYPKPDNMIMCFPHHYQLQSTDIHGSNFLIKPPSSPAASAAMAKLTGAGTAITTTVINGSNCSRCIINNMDWVMSTTFIKLNIKLIELLGVYFSLPPEHYLHGEMKRLLLIDVIPSHRLHLTPNHLLNQKLID
ncbi:unnamed protein product [Heterobilharzia americana]|nr:unnamed protein product [Heterobilharzia americana]